MVWVNNCFFFIYADICKTSVSRKVTYCLSNLVNINPLIMSDFPFIHFKIQLCKRYVVKAVWTSDSITKFDWVVKIRSIHSDEPPIINVGSLITCCEPSWEVTPSVLESSYVIMLLLYQRLNFALKPPRTCDS